MARDRGATLRWGGGGTVSDSILGGGGHKTLFNTNSIIAFDEGEHILILPLCAGSTELDAICFRAIFVWLAITIVSTSCATVNDLVNKHMLDIKHRQCMSFVADFLRFS